MLKAIQQSMYYAIGMIMMKGISFLMLPFIANAITPTEYGELDLWLSIMNVGSIVIGFGLIEALYKHAGTTDSEGLKTLIATASAKQAMIVIWTMIALLPFTVLLYEFLPTMNILHWILVAATLLVSAFINVPLTWLRLTDNAKQFFALTTGKALFQAALTLLLLKMGWGITGVLISGCLSSLLLAAILLAHQIKTVGLNTSPELGRQLLVYGFPLVGSGLLLFIATGAERWIIGGVIGLDSLAQYALAMQFAMMVAFLCEPVSLWWFPKRFLILNANRGEVRTARIAEGISHLSLWFASAIALFGPMVIQFWFPVSYHKAIPLLPWLAFGMALKQMSHVLNTGCYNQQSTTLILKINAVMAVVAMILFIVGGLQFGLTGIVVAFVLLYAIRAVLIVYISQRKLTLPYCYSVLVAHISAVLISLAYVNNLYAMLVLFTAQTAWFVYWCATQFKREQSKTSNVAKAVTL